MTADLLMRLRGARVPTYMHVGISEALERLMREAADEIERLQDDLVTERRLSESCAQEVLELRRKADEPGVKAP